MAVSTYTYQLPNRWILADVRRELVHMLHLNRKAEIQILSGPPSGELGVGHGEVPLGMSSNRLVEYIVSRIASGTNSQQTL